MKTRAFALALAVAGAAMAAPQAEIDAAIARGVKFLLAQQATDGSFSDPQMPALTALPLWALVKGGEGGGESAKKAAQFVLKTQRPDGGFYVPKPGRGGSGLGNYNTSVCVSALYESGLAPKRAILDARTYIAGSQLTGDDTMAGGFGYDRASRRRTPPTRLTRCAARRAWRSSAPRARPRPTSTGTRHLPLSNTSRRRTVRAPAARPTTTARRRADSPRTPRDASSSAPTAR